MKFTKIMPWNALAILALFVLVVIVIDVPTDDQIAKIIVGNHNTITVKKL
ncbi:MAG: hypothetical protein Q7U04_01750 [Bacteriovorax sp.]|nr:hypothetical protein [Bacteriovorax sp.]